MQVRASTARLKERAAAGGCEAVNTHKLNHALNAAVKKEKKKTCLN